jgi:hypothetical protein
MSKSEFRKAFDFAIEIGNKHPDSYLQKNGYWNAPSSLQPYHEYHGKMVVCVQFKDGSGLLYFEGIDKPVEADVSYHTHFICAGFEKLKVF